MTLDGQLFMQCLLWKEMGEWGEELMATFHELGMYTSNLTCIGVPREN